MLTISYGPLWKTLIDKKMNRGDLREAAGLSRGTITKMGKDEYVALDVVVRICNALHCGLNDVIELVPAPEEEKE